jgi:hypothetical protein
MAVCRHCGLLVHFESVHEVTGPSECRRPGMVASSGQIDEFSMKMHVFLRRGRPRAAGARAKTD